MGSWGGRLFSFFISNWSSRKVTLLTICFVRAKLQHTAAFAQLPIGLESEVKGIIDLVRWRAYYFEGNQGLVDSGTLKINFWHLKFYWFYWAVWTTLNLIHYHLKTLASRLQLILVPKITSPSNPMGEVKFLCGYVNMKSGSVNMKSGQVYCYSIRSLMC